MPATYDDIMAILNSPNLSESDKWVVRWQYRMLGDFETALANAIKRADLDNLEKLERGFPHQVQGFKDWAFGRLGERLRAAGLDI